MAIRETLRREHKVRTGITHGGIGTGGVELGKDGVLRHWNIFNNTPFGSGPALGHDWPDNGMLFFVVRYQVQGEEPRMKVLQIDEGSEVAAIPNHVYTVPWITGVDRIDCEQSYPYSRLRFTDTQMPLEVTLEAWSPFIPHNVKDSSLPAVFFDFQVRSRCRKPVDVLLLATARNAVGYDVADKRYASRIHDGQGYRMFEMTCDLVDAAHGSYGSQAMASLSSDTCYYLGFEHRHPYYEILIRNPRLPDIDDTEGRNWRTDEKTGMKLARGRANSSIGIARRMRPGSSLIHTFVMTWHLPNLYADVTRRERAEGVEKERRLEGHYYANFFQNAPQVATYCIAERLRLARDTRAFHERFFDSSLPAFVLDQVNSHLNTFVTSSWLTRAGDFGVQEGMNPESSFGPLATIDVAMYGAVTAAALFPELDKSMMRAHRRLQRPSGEVCHGIGRNFAVHDVHEGVRGRLDLPSQYVILALRGYFWTGDRTYLTEMWPSVTAALEYVLRERDMNADMLPDMEGSMCTYDNFPMFGAASYVASLWLAALACAVRAARALGDQAAAKRYGEVLAKATAAFEGKLWNGKYYRLYNDAGGKRGDMDDGCLTDQVIGQWAGHMVGAESLLDTARVRTALGAVMKMSYRPDYGLLNCRWPQDRFLHDVDKNCWSDQANTCWTGVELAFASFLLYEHMLREALAVIRNVDERYRKAGMYFDHQEFGGHYYRAMSAWGIVSGALGLAIDDSRYTFCPRVAGQDVRLFFAYGEGTAHYRRTAGARNETITIEVHTGTLRARELRLGLSRARRGTVTVRVGARRVADVTHAAEDGGRTLVLRTAEPLSVAAGQKLTVTAT